MIIGDSFSSIFKAAGLPSILSSRPAAISGVALCCSLPLCLLQSLERLKFSSLAGVGGLIYTAGFMTFRQCAGAYAPGGALFEATLPHMRPRFDALLSPESGGHAEDLRPRLDPRHGIPRPFHRSTILH